MHKYGFRTRICPGIFEAEKIASNVISFVMEGGLSPKN
jgi:hypothetical protein